MSNTLVVYFSASGETARLARTIAQAARADLCELRPAQPYTAADLNWHDPARDEGPGLPPGHRRRRAGPDAL